MQSRTAPLQDGLLCEKRPSERTLKSARKLMKGFMFRHHSATGSQREPHGCGPERLLDEPKKILGNVREYDSRETLAEAPNVCVVKYTPFGSGSSKMSDDPAVCALCDFPIECLLADECIVELDCSHKAHKECIKELAQTLGAPNTKDGMWCHICSDADQNSFDEQPVHASHEFHPIKKPEEYSPSSSRGSFTTSPMTPQKQFETYPHFASPSDEPKLSEFASLERLNNDFTLDSFSPGLTSASSPLILSAITVQQEANDSTVVFETIVSVTGLRSSLLSSPYTQNGEDILSGVQIAKELGGLKFKGVALKDLNMGSLRLRTRFSASANGINWTLATCYLFTNVILIVRDQDGFPNVKATVDIRTHLTSVEFNTAKGVDSLVFKLRTAGFSFLVLAGEHAELTSWYMALHYPVLKFPIAETSGSLKKISGGDFFPNIPLSLVVCIPNATTGSDRQYQELLKQVVKRMSVFDRLALVIYTKGSTKLIPSALPSQEIIRSYDQAHRELDASRSPGTCDMSIVLAEVENALKDLNAEEHMSSVIVVSDGESLGTTIPSAFVHSGTPVHTIGVTDGHNPVLLDYISRKTGGLYRYASTDEELKKYLCGLVDRERCYLRRSARATIIPSRGARVTKVLDLSTTSGSGHQQKACETLLFGNLCQGDCRSFVVETEVSNPGNAVCALFKVSLTARPMFSTVFEFESLSCPLVTGDTRLSGLAPSFEEDKSLVLIAQTKIMLEAATVLQELMDCLVTDNRTRAAHVARFRRELVGRLSAEAKKAQKLHSNTSIAGVVQALSSQLSYIEAKLTGRELTNGDKIGLANALWRLKLEYPEPSN